MIGARPPEESNYPQPSDPRGGRGIVAGVVGVLTHRWPSVVLVTVVWVLVDASIQAGWEAVDPNGAIFYGAWTPQWAYRTPWDLVYWYSTNEIVGVLLSVVASCPFIALLLRLCLADRSILEGLADSGFWRSVPVVGSVMFVHGMILLPVVVGGLLSGDDSPFTGLGKLAAGVGVLAGFFFVLWVVARFCFAYTFSALNMGFGIRQSWRASAKAQWSL